MFIQPSNIKLHNRDNAEAIFAGMFRLNHNFVVEYLVSSGGHSVTQVWNAFPEVNACTARPSYHRAKMSTRSTICIKPTSHSLLNCQVRPNPSSSRH